VPEYASDRGDQLGGVDRLGDVHEKAGAERAGAVLGAGERRQRDGRNPATALAPEHSHATQELVAVHTESKRLLNNQRRERHRSSRQLLF
jgi:hypothetical protein